jgi:glutamyl-tRNA synthetase
MTVRTRFAPSPTGLLHIGGARTALFNFLFARHHGGKFLLRIEDTDRVRSTEAATQAILDSLAWLDITADEPVVYQSSRAARHAEVAQALLEAGRAYRCWATPDELREMRERAMAEGRPPRYDGRWRDRDPAEAPEGVAPAIRLRAPREGETVIEDLVQGTVRVANAELDDMIILRGDGSPTYLHAVVVDDHDMAISHVIRGDDHLTNSFRQAQIYRALGWDEPAFAHIPLIHGPDGAKYSKRHGAEGVLEFREQGFLPEALCNYLLRLGWGHGDAEILGRDEAIALFDLDGVGRGAARMDFAKLTHVNAVWIRGADDRRLTDEALRRRPELGDADTRARVLALMPHLKERARTLVELADNAAFLAPGAPARFDDKARAHLTPASAALLEAVAALLAESDFTAEAIDQALRRQAEISAVKLGQIAQPLRAALTGSTSSPGIDVTLAALGREESLRRIAAAIALARGGDTLARGGDTLAQQGDAP